MKHTITRAVRIYTGKSEIKGVTHKESRAKVNEWNGSCEESHDKGHMRELKERKCKVFKK